MDVHLRKPLVDVPEQVEIVVETQLRMMPPLQQHLNPAMVHEFLQFRTHLLGREHVGVGVLLRPHERAKRAEYVADVRVVDIAIHDIGHDPLRMQASPHRVRQRPQLRQRQRLIQRQRLGCRHPAAVERLLLNPFKG